MKNIIAFDVDQTLITNDFKPIYKNIDLLIQLSSVADIMVWSGGGESYAEQWVERLNLKNFVTFIRAKNSETTKTIKPDITFDDQKISLGNVNIQLPY